MITSQKSDDDHKHFLQVTDEPIVDAYKLENSRTVVIAVGQDTKIRLMLTPLIRDVSSGVPREPASLRGLHIKTLKQDEHGMTLVTPEGLQLHLTAERITFFRGAAK